MMPSEDDSYAVIFDMDGVLADSYEAHYLSWVESCAKRGLLLSREKYAGLFGRSFAAFAEELCACPLPAAEMQQWYDEKEELYREIIEKKFPEKDGAGELIHDLYHGGILIGLASSGPRGNVECLLRHLPHAQYIGCTISGDDTSFAKPNPEPFLLCAGKLGIPPHKCLVVEDSIHGLQAARSAGMRAVGLTGTASGEELSVYADRVITSLRQLNADSIRDLIDGKGILPAGS